MSDTAKWLEELGAVRPMAHSSKAVLTLGEWHDGHYPIIWSKYRDRNGTDQELWSVFGLPVYGVLTRADCVRILAALQAAKGGDGETSV